MSFSISRTCHFPFTEGVAGTKRTGGWVDQRANLGTVEKK